jgi:hypothetical protein
MSPRTYSSVKFLSPIVTGGLPLPGCAPPDELELLELELELLDEEDPPDDDDDLELPQAASTATVARTPAVASARVKNNCLTYLSLGSLYPLSLWP